jgi:ferredoxin
MSVRITLDPVRCAGHGLCALLLEERVTLDEWGYPRVDPEPLDDGRPARRARRAARACPRKALAVTDTAEAPARSTVAP